MEDPFQLEFYYWFHRRVDVQNVMENPKGRSTLFNLLDLNCANTVKEGKKSQNIHAKSFDGQPTSTLIFLF